jgi:hypothetical protein
LTTQTRCKEAEHLFAAYTAVLTAFHDHQTALLPGATPDDAEFEKIQKLKELAFLRLSRARGRYWRHVQIHRCRNGGTV